MAAVMRLGFAGRLMQQVAAVIADDQLRQLKTQPLQQHTHGNGIFTGTERIHQLGVAVEITELYLADAVFFH